MNNLHIQSLLNNINSGIDLQTQIASIKKVFSATDFNTKAAIAEIAINHAIKYGYEAPSHIVSYHNEVKAKAEAAEKAAIEAAREDANNSSENSDPSSTEIEFNVSFIRVGNEPLFLNENKYTTSYGAQIPDEILQQGFDLTFNEVRKNINHYPSGKIVHGEVEGVVYEYSQVLEWTDY